MSKHQFPGECVRCGGPQRWTLDSSDQVWVRCEDVECLDDQLVLAGFEDEPDLPPPDGAVEPLGGERVVPPVGADSDEKERSVLVHIGVPLEAVLRNLWEGSLHGEET